MIGKDTEATGLDFSHGAKAFFVNHCDEDGNINFWEADVDPLTREPQWSEADIREIEEEANKHDEWVYQNPKFDFKSEASIGIKHPPDAWSRTKCTLMAGHLLGSNQPHDLTSMALVYLGINIKPLEEALKQACNEARRFAKSHFPTWMIAKEGLPNMPSVKPESEKKNPDGLPLSSPWANDMWLPRAIAKHMWECSECRTYISALRLTFLSGHETIEEIYADLSKAHKKIAQSKQGWEWRPPSVQWEGHHPWWTVLREYSNADPAVTINLYKRQRELLIERGLWEIYLERMKVLPVAHAMECRGVTISKVRVEELETQYTESAAKASRICCNLSGGRLEEMPKGLSNSIREVITEELGLVSTRKTDKGNPSYDKFMVDEWLITLDQKSKQYKFIKNLRDYRKRMTALGYSRTYKEYWKPLDIYNEKGEQLWYCLYSSINPTATSTLRWNSENPNQQQISKQEIEEEDGSAHNARYMFGPAPGREWWSCDAQNIELRIPAYEAGEQAMIDLFEKPDEPPYFGSNHLLFFDILHPDKWDRKDPEGLLKAKKKYNSTWYQWTKNGDFAVQYGAVAESGTADRAYHVPGGQKMIESRLSNIKKLSRRMIEFANETGYVETIPDKTVNPKRGYPLLCTRSKWGKIVETVPLSYHVQGTAMWWMGMAMVRCNEFLEELNRKKGKLDHYRITLQVHDELVFDFPRGIGRDSWKTNLPIIREIQRLMALGGEGIGVPTPVGCEYHVSNWGEGVSI